MFKYIFLALIGIITGVRSYADFTETYHVSEKDVQNGYFIKTVWLDNYARPDVKISPLAYKHDIVLPADAMPCAADNIDILLGMDRKKPFAVIRIPAFAPDEGHEKVKMLSDFTLTVTEKPNLYTTGNSAHKTTAETSPLASGNWYKIAVPNTGLFKVDFDFLASMGLDPATINPSSIRVFGNGGNMLPEDNAVPVKESLTENAIWVNDGGDGKFDQGDYFFFYAVGPTGWTPDYANKRFLHVKNLYEDKAYYFINFDAPGKRITEQTDVPPANKVVNSFNFYNVHDEDLYNPGRIGKTWWGEDFGQELGRVSERSIGIYTGTVLDSAKFRIQIASRCEAYQNSFGIWIDGQQIGNYTLGPANRPNIDDNPVTTTTIDWRMPYSGPNADVRLVYTPGVSSGVGYLGFIEVNTRQPLGFSDPYLLFRDLNSVGTGNIASYQLSNANSSTQVWDVTDAQNPVRMNGSLNGNVYTFSQNASTLHEFAAMNSNQLQIPEYVGTVANQNLLGSELVDYVIVSAPDFLPAAQKLADFHRQKSGMRVLVTTPQQVYNEFSSGGQDITAIRNFLRMLYRRAGTNLNDIPKYLLLLGDASYDYKNRIAGNTNFVPTFESQESLNVIQSYCNDDFFGFLDDSEYIERTDMVNALDIGIGRLPVKSLDEANAVVEKIFRYKDPESLGPWRLSVTFVADNEDNAGPHMEDGEIMDSVVSSNSYIYNGNKIYLDAIPRISTPGGQRAPDANKAINDQVFKGTFLINYNGHGNIDVLAHERIVTQDDYSKWKNLYKLPFMVTATCDFGRFDHPEYVSAGERIVLKPDGGAIASLTTTQLVYQTANRIINVDFLNAQFTHNGSQWNTFGDALRIGKNLTYSNSNSNSGVIVNFRKFALLGDPALEPNFPRHFIHTDEVLSGATNLPADTIAALGEYIFKGSVTDVNGNLLNGFNGKLSVTIFDKPRTVNTISGIEKTFKVQNNIIYKGNVTVTGGKFSFRFITPKDINYEFGKGKVSYYAQNGTTDGAGADTGKTVGGYSDYPVIEFDPPIVRPYIEDTLFRNGGLTGPNTLLFVILEDETGINVSGNGIGHDLTAVLDDDIGHPYIMNDYYETEENTYKRGYVNFPLYDLAEGRHRLTVRAWDVNNNSGEGYVDFEVVNGEIMKVKNMMNYPNPFRDETHFVFEHNHPDETLNVEINIYNPQGTWVKALKQTFLPQGSRSNEIIWDGADDNGVKLPSGVYVYRAKITTDKGVYDMAYQKLVIVR